MVPKGYRPAASRDDDDRPRRCPGFPTGGAVYADLSEAPAAARGRGDRRRTRDRFVTRVLPQILIYLCHLTVALGRDISELTSAVRDRTTSSLAPPYL
jgi:hypothetical protein